MKQTTVPEAIHLPDIINGKKVGAFQCSIAFLCGLVMFLDGFDTQAISYIAPLIAKEWNLSREMLGFIFSSALTGLMAGYLVLAPLSDRFGHRRMLLASTVTFSLFTLATVFASSASEVIALRFLAGVGLGAAIPSAVALTSEYIPKHLCASFVLAIYCGFSLGFVAAGIAAASLLPVYGWRTLLWVGGLTPLVLALVLFFRLPESLEFLVRDSADHNRIWNLLRRVDPGLTKPAGAARFTTDRVDKRSAVGSIFQSGRGAGTLLLCSSSSSIRLSSTRCRVGFLRYCPVSITLFRRLLWRRAPRPPAALSRRSSSGRQWIGSVAMARWASSILEASSSWRSRVPL